MANGTKPKKNQQASRCFFMADHLDRRVETTEVNLAVDPGKRKEAESGGKVRPIAAKKDCRVEYRGNEDINRCE